MGGCRCTYRTCVKATNNSDKDFHFFHYPVKDPQRCSKWIANAKKPLFHELPSEQLRNKVVCQLHFETPCFTNAYKNRLVHDAVPSLDGDLPTTKQDVQIVQNDFEGNVYSVDSNSIKLEDDVASYVIKNGNLVPANFVCESPNNTPIYQIVEEVNTTEIYTVQPSDPPTVPVKSKTQKARRKIKLTDKIPTDIPAPSPPEINGEITAASAPTPACIPAPTEKISKEIQTECGDKETLSDLMELVQRHSEEILRLKNRVGYGRSIKRRKSVGMSKTNLLKKLNLVLPPTLHAAVSLHLLKKKQNFSENELDFLSLLYNTSPKLYERFTNELEWKLPPPSQVKEIVSKNE